MVKSRKVKLYPVGDKEEVNRVYQYIRDGMYNQNKAYNLLVSEIYGAMMHGASKDEINLLYKRGKRRPKKDDPEFSLYDYETIAFPKGLDTASTVGQKAKKYFGEKVYKTVIPRNVRLSEAPSYGMPITEYDPRSKGAKSYIKFAKEFLKINGRV